MNGVWEHGSEFHAVDPPATRETVRHPWAPADPSYASGRDALRALMAHGLACLGWRRLWVPTYFCQEVISAVSGTGVSLRPYPDAPNEPAGTPDGPQPGDALLVVNTFGLGHRRGDAPEGVAVIEDHSHDPWSAWALESRADWCVVSLRKTLPISDGAVLWSPKGHTLPTSLPLTAARSAAAASKLAAMWLKRLYVQGHTVRKSTFRELATAGEDNIAGGEVSGISPWSREAVRSFGVTAWREARQRNVATLTEALSDLPWLKVFKAARNACAFSTVLVTDTPQRRDRLRKYLIEHRIYPASLWPLDETVLAVPDSHRDLSRRVLSLHSDGRYDATDMQRVAQRVVEGGR